ncbi:MAG: hypothetical protein ACRDA5_00515 [Clostridium sp.]
MELNTGMMYLSDEEIKRLASYLAYGAGIGILIGIFIDNISLYFSLGSVVGIVISIVVCFVCKYNEFKKSSDE